MKFITKIYKMRSSYIMIMFLSMTATGEIYQWKDENGKIHYGENSAAANKYGAETVKIRDKYHISQVDQKEPIKYSHSETHRTISFSSIELRLPNSDIEDVRVGRITCGQPIDLYWKEGAVNLLSQEIVVDSIAQFGSLGYFVRNDIGGSSSLANLKLKAEIIDLKMNSCPISTQKRTSKNATYVKIKWQLLDPLKNTVLYEGVSSGSHDALSEKEAIDGHTKSFSLALALATTNLLADAEFSANILPADMSDLIAKFDEPVAVKINYGTGTGTFNSQVQELKENAVIIKTGNGHGSGVAINDEGYILTNAHVIGEDSEYEVIINNQTFHAKLIRKELVRDVALLKIIEKTSPIAGVKLAHQIPGIGNEIYVIGTPLSLEHSQTITKGIISAVRNMQGLEYLQTDAAINRGNSGGPAFNENGELVALTVAGIFTNDGASVSINYLIPINDALKHLNLNNALNENRILREITTTLGTEPHQINEESDSLSVLTTIKFLLNWLNSPVL